MNYFFTIIVAVMLAGAALGSELTAPSKFDAANAAYDRGDFNQAQQLYGELLAGDLASVEILYNAGNAAFRRGFPGQAVLFYRRAWYLAPRDADIKANLQLAQQRAGSLSPANGLIQRAAQELSQAEWVRIFKGSFWATIALCALIIALPSSRRFLGLPTALATMVTVLALIGWLSWRRWELNPEVVVVRSGEQARYEPRKESTAFFSTPEGSILIREESFDNWVKVRDGNRSGWLPSDAAEQVYPWNKALR